MWKASVAGTLMLAGAAGCAGTPADTTSTANSERETLGSAGATAPASPSDTAAPTGAAGTPNAGVSTGVSQPPTATTPTGPTTAPELGASSTPGSNATAAEDQGLPAATGGPISEACKGFELSGLMFSPGGEVLPNKCEAYHPTLNSPYAVRCVDAWPWYKTQFPGDNYCILPPPPDKGIQVGHHPQGEGAAWYEAVSQGDMSGYETPPDGWTLESGGEEERNILIKHNNMGGKYYRVNSRMRGGSHHMIVSTVESGATFVWGPASPDGLFTGTGIPGAQRPDDNLPQSRFAPEEDVGLFREVAANATVQYNMHHFNSTDRTILKEAWQNLWWAQAPTTRINQINGLDVLQAVGTFAQPGQIVDMHYSIAALDDLRVLGLFGHRHAWTTNFSAWVESSGQEPTILYQSFDWYDEPTFNYSSEIENPMPVAATRTDGGHTGFVNLKQGDTLHFNCHIEYTDERAQEAGSPVTPMQNGPLRFANQAYNAEMCILFGEAVGNYGPTTQVGAPPEFARTR